MWKTGSVTSLTTKNILIFGRPVVIYVNNNYLLEGKMNSSSNIFMTLLKMYQIWMLQPKTILTGFYLSKNNLITTKMYNT